MGKSNILKAYLLDTHTFLWAVNRGDTNRLSRDVQAIIEDPETILYVSAASAYEIRNKHRQGKLAEHDYTARHLRETIETLGATELPIDIDHAEAAGGLPWAHRDPFDRLLAAQAKKDDLTLLTNDATLQGCPFVETLW
jgi:PIN domain nuclease of toxin-antitoxin system